MPVIFDLANPAHARVLERLATDRIAWLTTVTPDGQPETVPVWFLWIPATATPADARREIDAEILVYGYRRARRNRNLEANDRVSLALRTDEHGSDVVVIEGRATMDPDYPQVPDNLAYLEKYGESIDGSLGGVEAMAADYDIPIRIRPTRLITYG